MTRAVLYTRISHDKTGESVGVKRQERELRQYAQTRGLTVTGVYSDASISASTGKTRPGFERLLADVDQYDAVLVYAVDRLARRLADLERIIATLGDRPIHSILGSDVDLASPQGRMVARILGSVAAQEVETKASRQRSANKDRALRGEPSMAAAPWGFIKRDGTIAPDPTLTDTIADMYARLLAGESLSSIGRDHGWRQTKVRHVLENPAHGGLSVYQGKIVGTLKYGGHVSETTWRRAEAKLADPGRSPRRGGGGRPTTTSLAGLLTCSVCNGSVVASSNNTIRDGARVRYLTFGCKARHVSRDRQTLTEFVEGQVVDLLIEHLPALQAAEARRLSVVADPSSAIGEIASLKEQVAALAASMASGVLDLAAYTEAEKVITARIAALKAEVESSTEPAVLTGMFPNPQAVAEEWEALAVMRRNQILKMLIDTVIVEPGRDGDVTIQWRSMT